MMAVDILLARTSDGHSAVVVEDYPRDSPPLWMAVCSCGWESPHYVPLGCKRVDSVTEGTADSALTDLLTHVGYDPDEDAAAVHALIERNTKEITRLAEEMSKASSLHQRHAGIAKGTP